MNANVVVTVLMREPPQKLLVGLAEAGLSLPKRCSCSADINLKSLAHSRLHPYLMIIIQVPNKIGSMQRTRSIKRTKTARQVLEPSVEVTMVYPSLHTLAT